MKVLLVLAGMITLLARPEPSLAQETTGAPPQETQSSTNSPPQSSPNNTQNPAQAVSVPNLDDNIQAGESDDEPERKLVRWNHYEGPYFTFEWAAVF